MSSVMPHMFSYIDVKRENNKGHSPLTWVLFITMFSMLEIKIAELGVEFMEGKVWFSCFFFGYYTVQLEEDVMFLKCFDVTVGVAPKKIA